MNTKWWAGYLSDVLNVTELSPMRSDDGSRQRAYLVTRKLRNRRSVNFDTVHFWTSFDETWKMHSRCITITNASHPL